MKRDSHKSRENGHYTIKFSSLKSFVLLLNLNLGTLVDEINVVIKIRGEEGVGS